MVKTAVQILSEYKKWRKDWDALCNQCGQCCYTRTVSDDGEVLIDPFGACKFLDEETHKCSVFEDRFNKYPYCGKVNLAQALFNPTMPPDCAYVKTFRLWKKPK